MKQVFNTSVGTIEVLVDRESRTISIYRFDDQNRPAAAAIESWDHVDLLEVLTRQAGVPLTEANRIATTLREQHMSLGSLSDRLEQSERGRSGWSSLENAGIALRFVAVLLDAVIVFFPLGIVVGLMTGGGYAERGAGYANAGINVGGSAFLLLLALGLGYYIVCEAATGATLGKLMVGIRVVGEDGEHATFGAAVVRNLLRLVDALFFYLVGAVFALTSTRGQRLGDRAAHTIVVRG
ncbi:MAG: RDD family protein [Actinobacteria bacterium]|nr:MAG: RDD family protein [Actinomycetota bacterium]